MPTCSVAVTWKWLMGQQIQAALSNWLQLSPVRQVWKRRSRPYHPGRRFVISFSVFIFITYKTKIKEKKDVKKLMVRDAIKVIQDIPEKTVKCKKLLSPLIASRWRRI